MNKQLLTIAGLLSMLAVNQAFGWKFPIKNETTRSKVYGKVQYPGTFTEKSIKAGKTVIYDAKDRTVELVSIHSHSTWEKNERLAQFIPRKDSNGKTINPIKGLTIKTVNGQTVVVENP